MTDTPQTLKWGLLAAAWLAVMGAGCSAYPARWRQAADDPAVTARAPGDLVGRWDGLWLSSVNGHTGRLRAIVTPAAGSDPATGPWLAGFHAIYEGWVPFDLDIPLTAQRDDSGRWRVSGTYDLGPWGAFTYEGTIEADELIATYDSWWDRGVMRLVAVDRSGLPANPVATNVAPAAAELFTGAAPPPDAPDRKAIPQAGELGHAVPDWLAEALPRDKVTVLMFAGIECGVVDRHQPLVAALAHDFNSRGVAVVEVFANPQDSEELIAAYARRVKLNLSVRRDPQQTWANYFGVTHTPQFVIVDAKGHWRYSGPYRLNTATADSPSLVRQALEAILAGGEVATPRAKAYGCKLSRP